jgi:putative ATP-binding cassette transporter
VYIFYLSPVAFVLTLIIAGSGLAIHIRRRNELMQQLQRATTQENEFFTALTHLIDGFKEVKLSEPRSVGVFQHLSEIAASVAEVKTKTAIDTADYYIFSQVIFYILIGSMVFILPQFTETYSNQIAEITTTILFIIGPLTIVVGSIPVVSAANTAVANIGRLEDALDRAQSIALAKERDVFQPVSEFDTIEFDNVEFAYPHGERDFKVGPVNLSIRCGEILFITGGNGSGKTTFLRVLTALYYPTAGVVRLNGTPVDDLGYRTYRNLFSAIFSDYHLFDRLYGIDANPADVQTLLERMDLDKKTRFVNGQFLNQELSTGQRKRLALIVSLLEDRPIYVFDEWAADQDPTFRMIFYKEMLADLKRRGKTVIAATHDDHYFQFCDRRFNMDEGQLTAVETRGNVS